MYEGVGWDIESTVNYLNELGERTMRGELFAVADLLEKTAKDRDHWKSEFHDQMNRSLKHGEKMMGEVLKGLISGAGTDRLAAGYDNTPSKEAL
jgi:hypothetical protein